MITEKSSLDVKEGKAENLLAAGIAAYYFAQVLVGLWNGNLFNNLGSDYLSFWSSGYIANTKGLIFIYDLDSQAAVQGLYAPIETLGVVPTPLFPVFILPFQIMAFIPPGISFLIWTVINVIALFLYIKKRLLLNLPMKYLWLASIAAPVFQNTYFGQVEVWLMIFMSEFLITWTQGKFFKSGLWLGLTLLKPQLLILVIPFLVIQRYWKVLAGFVAVSFFVLLLSFLLVGMDGLIQIVRLWLGYSTGLPSNAPEVMMNWRMLGLHVSRLIAPTAGTVIIVLGSVITLWLCLPLFFSTAARDNTISVISLFGIFSATLAITWHSHQHMSMILLPFFFKLLQEGVLPAGLFKAWIFIPVLTYIAVIPIVVLITLNILPMVEAFGGLMTGACMLAFNLLFLYKAQNLHRKASMLKWSY